MNESELSEQKQRLPHLFQKGQSGNPAGRPKGSISIKTAIKKLFRLHPERYKSFVDKLVEENPALVWQMLEGRPAQSFDHSGELEHNVNINNDGEIFIYSAQDSTSSDESEESLQGDKLRETMGQDNISH